MAVTVHCSVDDSQNSNHVKAKCRLRVRHATKYDLEKTWTGSLSFDPEKDDDDGLRVFAEDMRLASIETNILADYKGYLVDDTLRFLCHIDAQTIGAETTDDPSRKRQQYEDVALIVGGRRIYANKGILAAHCEFFNAAFFGEGGSEHRNQEERELPDVDPDDFETFKAVIYPTQKALDADNIYAVVSLTDRFVAMQLLDKCEEFMLEELEPADTFKGLSQYIGLDDLKSKFLAAMTDKELAFWATPEGRRALTKDNMELVLLENVSRRAQF